MVDVITELRVDQQELELGRTDIGMIGGGFE